MNDTIRCYIMKVGIHCVHRHNEIYSFALSTIKSMDSHNRYNIIDAIILALKPIHTCTIENESNSVESNVYFFVCYVVHFTFTQSSKNILYQTDYDLT